MTTSTDKGLLLADLREKITATDQAIIKLLGARRSLVLEVGEVKRKNDLPVRDAGREEALLAILCTAGREVGLSAEYVTSLYRLIIEKSVAEELELMKGS